MQGPDAPSDSVQSEFGGTTNNDHFSFSGGKEVSYEEFLRKIRQIGFDREKGRDSAWMADLVSLHLTGDASKWFESLDDKTQQDWNLLKRAFLDKYGDTKPKVTGTGESLDGGVANSPKPSPPTVSSPPKPTPGEKAKTVNDPLLPARIQITKWSSPVASSTILFPKSKGEWLREAKQRKSKFSGKSGTVYWHLVEPSQWLPENLIPIAVEGEITLYSVRAWQEGGLTLGKLAITGSFWLTKRAWIPWYGKEVKWNGPFEVLVGDKSAVRWVKPQSAGKFTAVEGGFEVKNNKALLIALCDAKKWAQPGKVFSSESKAYYPYAGVEHCAENFCVLAWA